MLANIKSTDRSRVDQIFSGPDLVSNIRPDVCYKTSGRMFETSGRTLQRPAGRLKHPAGRLNRPAGR